MFQFLASKVISEKDFNILDSDASVQTAIKAIENNPFQTVFVLSDDRKLVGIVTNGDVRRFLLAGGRMDAPVSGCMNRNFRSVAVGGPREQLLRLFDMGFSIVPQVDEIGRLISAIVPTHQHLTSDEKIVVRARAPARISFAGGGSDLTYFFSRNRGLVLNAAVAMYASATLIPRQTPEIDIHSHDLGLHQHFRSPKELLDAEQHGLVSATAALIHPDFGFELHVSSDFPVGSGLGGSSAVTTSIVAAFNELRLLRWSAYDIAEIAFQAERLCFKIPGGWQDQYAASFGGFNLIEFQPSGNVVNPLRLPADLVFELEESLVLFDTGIRHDSGNLHRIQKSQMAGRKGDEVLSKVAAFCVDMNRSLARGDLIAFGEGLHEAWLLKKATSSAVSTDFIDKIYAAAKNAGAIGGKLLGAGAGGHMLFFAPPGNRASVIDAVKPFDCKVRTVRFDEKGAHSWRTKTR